MKKELREEEIKSKIMKLTGTQDFIEENLPDNFEEFNKSKILKNGIYKEIEFSIELILDVCSIINSDLRLGMPEDEENIIDNLEDKKIFSEKLIKIIREMKRFRNILVHRYGEINDRQAFENIKEGLKDFELFIKEVEDFLKKQRI